MDKQNDEPTCANCRRMMDRLVERAEDRILSGAHGKRTKLSIGGPPYATPSTVTPLMPTKVYWQCQQVSYSIAQSDVRVGLRVGFNEHAMDSFARDDLPKTSRFWLGTITEVRNGLMTIDFDGPPNRSPMGVTCGVKEYAHYLVPAGNL